jgi:polysaccharide pyruvyl transferase WcaK-like protein
VLTVLHAYSATNAGDGFLVDLTLRLLEESVGKANVRVVALDPESFTHEGTTGLRFRTTAHGPSIREAVAGSSALVGVGGGYLRASDAVGTAKYLVAHLSQLHLAARADVPCIYLPQSVGPLPPVVRQATLSDLKRLESVLVRDDRSALLLRDLPNVRRTPDLAVLEVARTWRPVTTGQLSGPVVIVARRLSGGNEAAYKRRLQELRRLLPDAVWAVQAQGRGNRDDEFYDSLGVSGGTSLRKVLAEAGPGVVVSVRMHGALEALERGWAAVHLSYERKGFGAYADLGLEGWLHQARSFDPSTVADQVRALQRDPLPYFAAVSAKLSWLRLERGRLVDEMSRRLGGRL